MTWIEENGLGRRLEDLPLILCGPILRRTEPDAVTVWLALKQQQTVTLRVYSESEPTSGSLEQLTVEMIGTRQTIALGEHLHVVALTARPQGEQRLVPGTLYYYNLFFPDFSTNEASGDTAKLNTPGIFEHTAGINLEERLEPNNLSYSVTHRLPSFALPPNNLNKLRIVHGSCRKPHNEGRDAFPALDDMLKVDWPVTEERPHLLLLTGDQIYADDVGQALLFLLIDAGHTLLGWTEKLPGINPENLKPAALVAAQGNNQEPPTPVEVAHTDLRIGSGKRTRVSIKDAGLTSEDTECHLFSLGEFYAMYLFVWSEMLWPEALPEYEDVFPGKPRQKLRTASSLPTDKVDTEGFSRYQSQRTNLQEFRQALPKVRRALANVPIYMMFDDHEVTDDWYIARDWCQVVLTSPLGRRTVQNALLAYAVFQAWGNAPDQFVEASEETGDIQPGTALLQAAHQWSQQQGNDDTQNQEIARRVGIPDDTTVFTIDQESGNSVIASTQGGLIWNYHIDGPNYEIIVLDTRTKRSYGPGPLEPPRSLISRSSLNEQLVLNREAENEITFVISPTPFLPYPFFDHWLFKALIPVARFLGRYLDDIPKRALQFPYFPEFGDHWQDPKHRSFELLLSKLVSQSPESNNHRQGHFVLLTGDIHSSSVSRLGYAADRSFTDEAQPQPSPIDAVVVQLTASAFKKEDQNTRFLHYVGYEYRWVDILKGLFGGTARDWKRALPRSRKWLGWRESVSLGISSRDLARIHEIWQDPEYLPILLSGSPPVLSVEEFENEFIPRSPDWRYRIDYIAADTSDREPAPFAPQEVFAPSPGDRIGALQSYLAMAKNHQDYARKWGHGKEVVGVNNISEVSFQWEARTTLTTDITPNATEFTVQDAAAFPSAPFYIKVGEEFMEVKASDTIDRFSSIERGLAETSALAYGRGSEVRLCKTLIQETWWRLEDDSNEDEFLQAFPLSKFRVSFELNDPRYAVPEVPGRDS